MTTVIRAMSRGREFIDDNLHSFYNDQLEPAIDRLALSKFDRDRLFQVVSEERPTSRLPMSNEAVRRVMWRALASAMIEFFEAIAADARLRFFFLTAVWDDGFVPMPNPSCDLARLKQKVRDLLYDAGLNGLCALEANPMRDKLFGEDFRRVWFHVHGIIWTRDPAFDHRDLEAKMQGRFPNMLGAPGLKLTTRADYVMLQRRRGFDMPDPHADMMADDIAYLIAYMLKAPNAVKRLISDPDDPSRVRLKTSTADFTGQLALQMTQIWSYLTPFDTVFAVREGKVPRAMFSQAIRDWEQQNRRLRSKAHEVDLTLFWRNVGRCNPRFHLGECNLVV